MLTDAERNRAIALAMFPERQGWGWTDADCAYEGGCHTESWANECEIRDCHGTGRVPVDLAEPRHTLPMVEWAATQEWWRRYDAGDFTWQQEVDKHWPRLSACRETAPEVGRAIRDIIYEVLVKERER